MKDLKTRTALKFCGLLILVITLAVSCKVNNAQLTADENALVKDSVNQMAINISRDVSAKGPIAWLNYFENAPGFFMANDGRLVFRDYQSGTAFVKDTVIKKISKITLSWKNAKIDPLTSTYASFGADFQEDLVLANGNKLAVDGYLTATTHFDGNSWKLRNLNWATRAPTR